MLSTDLRHHMIGTKLAHYEITGHLGSGSMGEVYQATDTTLGRSVAIKILPEAFAHDADRLARFKREARVLASLNHPNIAAIYGLEQSAIQHFLVMELVGGETLAERIKRGRIPVDESLGFAKQIAEALEAAHENGVIHRDLKPANIKVTSDGQVKILDFGLAKAFASEPSSAHLSDSPTLSMAATNVGVILGTAAYMSPEQAKGRTVDRRCDIFSFGCVVYEMLTGYPAFPGDDVTEILGRVVTAEPDWSRLPAGIPAGIPRMLRRALKKDPRQRLGDIRDARIEIAESVTDGERPVATVSGPGSRLVWIAFAAVVLLVIVLAIPALRHLREAAMPSLLETRTDIVTPAGAEPLSFALSPDGRHIVFTAPSDGLPRLWLRSLAATAAQPLDGTEGGLYPFWAPDSGSVGFFAGGELKKVDIRGGMPQTLAAVKTNCCGTWNADGVILFGRIEGSPLLRVSASGGQTVAVTRLDGQTSHRSPSFLPGGRQFLFYVPETTYGLPLNAPERAGIFLGHLDSAETQRLTAADASGVYLASGWLLWVRAGTLVAQRLDLKQKALIGDPVTVAAPVAFNRNGVSAVSVSATGLIAYRAGSARWRQLTWFDRSGKPLGTMSAPDEQDLNHPSLSPDARQVAVSRTQGSNTDIWLLDGIRMSRFTTDTAPDSYPIWSPNGSRIVFGSNRNGRQRDLYEKSSTGGSEEPLLKSLHDKVATDWSADGRFILYFSVGDQQTGRDVWVLPMDERKPWIFLNTPSFQERFGQFSPNGRWIAYMSNESGRPEIYIREFTAPVASRSGANARARYWLVSAGGGNFPRWRPGDGQELYYVGPNGEMMAVAIKATGNTPEPGAPAVLFPTRILGGGRENGQGRQYDVTRDGRFLINAVLDDGSSPITLVQNWKPPSK